MKEKKINNKIVGKREIFTKATIKLYRREMIIKENEEKNTTKGRMYKIQTINVFMEIDSDT